MVTPSIPAGSKGPLTSRQNLVLQPLDQQWEPTTNNYYPAITTISSEQRPDGKDRVFVETFLIDAVSAPNKKGWRVSYDNPEDFDSRVQASKNHPLVLFQTPHPTKDGEMIFDHPVAPITSLEAAADPVRATIEFQKKYTIGYARHFKKVKDGIWHAVYEITNNKAKKFFQKAKEKGLKLYTSPHIVRPSSEPDRKNIHEWALIHNAIVSNPAFNETIATVKDVKAVSARYPLDFSSLFASIDTKDDDSVEEEELDAEYLLTIYTNQLTSHHNNNDIVVNMPESASINSSATFIPPNQASTIVTTNPANPEQATTVQVPAAQAQQTLQNEPQAQQEENNKQQLEQEQKQRTEFEELKQQLEQERKSRQALEQKYAQDTRKIQIEKLFAPLVGTLYTDPNTGRLHEKDYENEVTKFLKSNHTYDEISEILQARYILAQYHSKEKNPTSNEKASFNSQESASAHIAYTKLNTTNNDSGVIAGNSSLGINVLRRLSSQQQGGLY
jgi:hypothetical protein